MVLYQKLGVNCGLAECRLGIEIQLTLNYPPKSKKVYSIFSKIAGLGSAHKIFRYCCWQFIMYQYFQICNRKKSQKTVKTVKSKIKKRKTSVTKWMNMHNMQHLQCKIKPPLQQYKLNARVVLNVLKRGKSVILFACYGFISNIT